MMKTLRLMLALMMAGALPAFAAVNVITQHNDVARTGQNLSETVLTPSNVNDTHFGLLHKIALDDQCYANPLVYTGLTIAGGVHNVVYMETVNNSVYALDATTGAQLWHVNFGTAAQTSDYPFGGCVDISVKFGIMATPVINAANSCLYVVSITNGAYGDAAGVKNFRLHKLDLATGNEDAGSPALISASNFNPIYQNNRPALLNVNSKIYVCFGSHCDATPSNGRIFAFDAGTLAQTGEFNLSVPGGSPYLASIWQAGQGPAADSSGNIYFITGNGTWDGVNNFGMSFMKMSSTLGLSSYFTANDYANLNNNDEDLGSGGCMVMPGTGYIVGGGKSGKIYVLNPASLGGLSANDANAVQVFQAVFPNAGTGHIHGAPAYFANSTGPAIYVWGEDDHGRCYQYVNGKFNTTPSSMTAAILPETNGPGMCGGNFSISANGTTDAIAWAYGVLSGNANQATQPGILFAFDANNLATQLWSSQDIASRDSMGNLAKYSYPVIANGLVYISDFGTASTGTGGLCIYGPLSGGTEGPYGGTPAPIPGTVQGENYDTGGQGLAYNVTSINGTDNGYRSDGVNLEVTSDTGGGVDLGWTTGTQWFRYTVNVATAGNYTVSFRVAAPSAVTDAFHLSNSSGTNLSGSVNLPATGGFQTWTTVTATVTLPAGQQVLTLNQDNGGWNINYMSFATSGGGGTTVNLSSSFNTAGIYTDGTTFSGAGGIDGGGHAYSANLLGTSQNWSGDSFVIGAANINNVVAGAGQVITLPSGSFSSLKMLAAAVNGNQASQTFTVTYTDNSTSVFTQSLSNWNTPQSYTGESIAVSMAYRNVSNGTKDARTFDLFGYSFALNNTKTVKSITLPNNGNVKVLSLTIQ